MEMDEGRDGAGWRWSRVEMEEGGDGGGCRWR